MTATQAPTPGPLTSESVKLLVKGDLLWSSDTGRIGRFSDISATKPFCLHIWWSKDTYSPTHPLDGLSFVGRPDSEGWMPWSGGENPVPGQRVDIRNRGGDQVRTEPFFRQWEMHDQDSETLLWQHRDHDNDIIAFRLAPTAPVEASGSEREFETAEAMAEAWSDRVEIQHMVDVTSAVFAKWASPELLSRFRQQMMAVIQQAYIEGVSARVEAHRPQPSGETREKMRAIIDAATDAVLPSVCETTGLGTQQRAMMQVEIADRILSARPLALGGQQGVQERCQRCGGEVQGWLCQSCPAEFRENDDGHLVFDEDTTPARAEAQDEGAAGECENCDGEGWIEYEGGDVGGSPSKPERDTCLKCKGTGRIAAHPSPPPAADADRVRIAVEALEDISAGRVKPSCNEPGLIGRLRERATEALAALKSTAAKEGGEL